MAIWTATALPENVEVMFKDAFDVAYVLADGSVLPVIAEPVWCDRCNRVTNGERIETGDVLDRIAVQARQQVERPIRHDSLDVDALRTTVQRHAANWGKDLRLVNRYGRPGDLDRRRQWLFGRRSPPKCLQCGSTDVVPFPPSLEMSHPRGHGRLRLHSPRLADYWGDWPSRLTPEGNAIRTQRPRRRLRWWWSFGSRHR